jgi:hypothetical protein
MCVLGVSDNGTHDMFGAVYLPFIHSSGKYQLRPYYVSGIVLGSGTSMKKRDICPFFSWNFHLCCSINQDLLNI